MEQTLATVEVAARLLQTVWTQISPDYKRQYARDIWTQFESRVAACAGMSSSLPKFLSQLCGMCNVPMPGRSADDRQDAYAILAGGRGNPDDILWALRKYPQLCALQVRIWNDELKARRGQLVSVGSLDEEETEDFADE